MEKIIIRIDPFGRSKSKAEGFVGGTCSEPINEINRILGGEGQITPTEEMYLTETQQTEETQSQYDT